MVNVMDTNEGACEHFLAFEEVPQVGSAVSSATRGTCTARFDNLQIIYKTGITQVKGALFSERMRISSISSR